MQGSEIVLVGDIGGTNARLSLWGSDSSNKPVELMANVRAFSEMTSNDWLVDTDW